MEKDKITRESAPHQNGATNTRLSDMAPADEAQQMDDFVKQTQKGKNKVDGDLSQESDRPIEQER